MLTALALASDEGFNFLVAILLLVAVAIVLAAFAVDVLYWLDERDR